MKDRFAVLVHWLVAWLLRSPSGVLRIEVEKGQIGKVRWYNPEWIETGEMAEEIDLDNPYLSKYLKGSEKEIKKGPRS